MPTQKAGPDQLDVTADSQPGTSILMRLGWMVCGTLTMLIAGFTIVSSPTWTFGLRDYVFWAGALGAMTFRYFDIKRFDGQTSGGEPASMAHFARYAVGLSGAGLAFWLFAQSVQI